MLEPRDEGSWIPEALLDEKVPVDQDHPIRVKTPEHLMFLCYSCQHDPNSHMSATLGGQFLGF